MANTRSNPDEFDYVPRQLLDNDDGATDQAAQNHPAARKPKRPLTGRAGLYAGDKREQQEIYNSQLGTGADITVSREKLDDNVIQIQKIRQQLGRSAVQPAPAPHQPTLPLQ